MRVVSLADAKPDPKNARRHTPRNLGIIQDSIQRDGFGRPILLASDGTIIAGNATAEAAGAAGLEEMMVVESDGRRVVAVRRSDVHSGSPEAVRLALADNRATDLSDWETERLRELAADDDIDLSAFWHDDELSALLAAEDDDVRHVEFDAKIKAETSPIVVCPECGAEFDPSEA